MKLTVSLATARSLAAKLNYLPSGSVQRLAAPESKSKLHGQEERRVRPSRRLRQPAAEDETLLRMMTIDRLEEAGFDAAEVASGEEALRARSQKPGVPGGFTDVALSGPLHRFSPIVSFAERADRHG